MANFLVVCGGAGRGILKEKNDLGFVASLQVDTEDARLPNTDGHSYFVDLSLLSHMMTNVGMLSEFESKCVVKIVKLDKEIATIESTIAECLSRHNEEGTQTQKTDTANSLEARLSFLLRQRNELQIRLSHTQKARSNIYPAVLAYSRSVPSICRALIEGEKQTQAITNALTKMMSFADAGDEVVTFWVVASVCGGVGQGVYTHVIDQIYTVMQSFPNKALQVKVVRVGRLSYASLSPSVNLNTFWSVLTDYGYIKTHADKFQNGKLHSQLSYYYIDMPNVGPKTQDLFVFSAFKAITQKYIDRQFDLVFNSMIGPKVVLARIGLWGEYFLEDSVYDQTIIDLQQQLQHLLAPAATDVLQNIIAFEKTYNGDSSLDIEAVSARLTTLVVNSLTQIGNLPRTLRVSDIEQRAEWSRIVDFVEQIQPTLASTAFHHHVRFRIDLLTQSNLSIEFTLSPNRTRIFNEAYIREVEFAQIVVAKFDQLISSEHNEERIYHKLVDAYNALRKPGISWLFSSDKDKNEHVIVGIQNFFMHYAYVSKMLAEYKKATTIIDLARHELSTVTNTISNIRQTMFREPSQVNTKSVALHDSFGETKTWLQIIDENLRGNPEFAWKSHGFRSAVQMGARSLTESGLKQVLDVPANTSTQQIVQKINDHDGAQSSMWWQGIMPNTAAIPAHFRFTIRLFPQLPEHTFAQMQEENLAYSHNRNIVAPFYIVSDDNRHDLKIYAVECISAGDSLQAQFNQLIRPLLGIIQTDTSSDRQNLAKHCLFSTGTPVYLPAELDVDDHEMMSLKRLLTEDLADCVTVVTDVA